MSADSLLVIVFGPFLWLWVSLRSFGPESALPPRLIREVGGYSQYPFPLLLVVAADFNIAGGTVPVQEVLENWEEIIGNASVINTGFIVLEHDLFQQSVDVATGYIVRSFLICFSTGYRNASTAPRWNCSPLQHHTRHQLLEHADGECLYRDQRQHYQPSPGYSTT
jgi:hypothetical protein